MLNLENVLKWAVFKSYIVYAEGSPMLFRILVLIFNLLLLTEVKKMAKRMKLFECLAWYLCPLLIPAVLLSSVVDHIQLQSMCCPTYHGLQRKI